MSHMDIYQLLWWYVSFTAWNEQCLIRRMGIGIATIKIQNSLWKHAPWWKYLNFLTKWRDVMYVLPHFQLSSSPVVGLQKRKIIDETWILYNINILLKNWDSSFDEHSIYIHTYIIYNKIVSICSIQLCRIAHFFASTSSSTTIIYTHIMNVWMSIYRFEIFNKYYLMKE